MGYSIQIRVLHPETVDSRHMKMTDIRIQTKETETANFIFHIMSFVWRRRSALFNILKVLSENVSRVFQISMK